MRFFALLGLLALTACGTYAVRMYDHYGAAERGEAPADELFDAIDEIKADPIQRNWVYDATETNQ